MSSDPAKQPRIKKKTDSQIGKDQRRTARSFHHKLFIYSIFSYEGITLGFHYRNYRNYIICRPISYNIIITIKNRTNLFYKDLTK